MRQNLRTAAIFAIALSLAIVLLVVWRHTLVRSTGVSPVTVGGAGVSPVAVRSPSVPPATAGELRIVATADGFAPVMDLPQPDPRSRWKNPAKPVEPIFPKNFADAVRVRWNVAEGQGPYSKQKRKRA